MKSGRDRARRLKWSGVLALPFTILALTGTAAAATAGGLDPTFTDPDALGVNSLVVQPNGRVLIGGDFVRVGGQERLNVARLNSNGTLDSGFVSALDPSGGTSSLLLQADGKVLVGGNGVTGIPPELSAIARINSNGSLDSGFNLGTVRGFTDVYSQTLQPDGKILIVGTGPRVVRLNADGTRDASFTTPSVSNNVTSVALQPDGKVLIAGFFDSVAGQRRSGVARLNANGTLDPTFVPPDISLLDEFIGVDAINLQPDGKVLIAGEFTFVSGQRRRRVARLNANGTLDTTFADPGVSDGNPRSLVIGLATQPDGKVLIGGLFGSVGGQPRSNLARLNEDGTLDVTFENPQVNNIVRSVATQPDAKVLIGGDFSTVAGEPRRGAARLTGTSFPLTLSRSGPGSVTSSPRGINCEVPTATCSADFEQEAQVTLTADPADGAQLTGWGGACNGTAPTCELTMNEARDVSATFAAVKNPERLEVSRSGPGKVVSSPAGIDCGKDCLQFKERGTFSTLIADPNDDARFTGWSGDCSGTSTYCNLWMTGNRSVKGSFKELPPNAKYLTVTRLGSGAGSVTSTPAGINCGEDCVQGFLDGTKVTLKANPADNARFAGWAGACSGSGATCTVNMNQTRGVTATFEELPADSPVLTVTKSGTGAGAITSTPVGINCGPDCRQAFLQGAKVTLTAKPRAGASFTGWSGACSGSSTTCSVIMDQSLEVSASFRQLATLVSVNTRPVARNIRVNSRLSVTSRGRVTQRVTTGSGRKARTWCRNSRSVKRAATVKLRCNLGRNARARLRKRNLPVVLRITFRSANQGAVTVSSKLTIQRRR